MSRLSGNLLTAVSQIYPASDNVYQFVEPKTACVTGSCLVAWHEADGETSPQGKYILPSASLSCSDPAILGRHEIPHRLPRRRQPGRIVAQGVFPH